MKDKEGETQETNSLAMVEVKEELNGDEILEKVEEAEELLPETKLSKETEDTLNNNAEKGSEHVVKLETENSDGSYRLEDEDDDDALELERSKGLQGMSPVETATLLLLSRIALFNKVGDPSAGVRPSLIESNLTQQPPY